MLLENLKYSLVYVVTVTFHTAKRVIRSITLLLMMNYGKTH